MESTTSVCALVIDEDASFCLSLSECLSAVGLEVRVTADSIEGLGFLHEARPPLVFIDVDAARYGGVRTAQLAASLNPRAIIVLTGKDELALARAYASRAPAAVAVLRKPVSRVQAQQFAQVALATSGHRSVA